MKNHWRNKDFLNCKEYAEATGMSAASVYMQVKAGFIPFIRTGPRSIRIPTQHLKDLEAATTSATN